MKSTLDHIGPQAAVAIERLRGAVERAGRRARSLGRPVLAWTTTAIPSPDLLGPFDRSTAEDRIVWMRPCDRVGLAGIGSAWTFTAEGSNRLAQADAAWRSLLDRSDGEFAEGGPGTGGDVGLEDAGPIAFYGFAFTSNRPAPHDPAGGLWAGYPGGRMIIPRLSVRSTGGSSRLTLSVVAGPSGQFPSDAYDDALACLAAVVSSDAARQPSGPRRPSRPEEAGHPAADRDLGDLHLAEEFPLASIWKRAVGATAAAIGAGRLRKAVLARGVRVRAARLDAAAALRRLCDGYPECIVFAVAHGARCFLGATPERLVRVRGSEASLAAVAGTAPRGRTDAEDRVLGERLLASQKDQIEHALVVEALRAALADVSTAVCAADAPRLLTLRNAHHLYTPFHATLREPATVLALARRLHPTPAVAGVPRDAALAWIRDHEQWDRGWYAGPIGWIDGKGEGESAVAIRSALVDATEARVFAGCGIMATSDPEQEYAESLLKLEPVLSALRAVA